MFIECLNKNRYNRSSCKYYRLAGSWYGTHVLLQRYFYRDFFLINNKEMTLEEGAKELEKYNNKLVRALKTKTEFLARCSHELR